LRGKRGWGVGPTMERQARLIHKVKRLLRKTGLPRWLHHFGPKKYEFWQHALALLIKQECRLGFRRITALLRGLGLHAPCPSALCMSQRRIPLHIWQRMLQATAGTPHLAAIDGTGMSRILPSPYYYRRIDKPYPVEVPLKLSVLVDTRTKKVLSLRVRAKRAHDIKDVRYLLKRAPTPQALIGDKAYDAEWLHGLCQEKGIEACIPIRKWGKPRVGTTRLRYRAARRFDRRRYNRRVMVESVFSSLKRKFGVSLSSVQISAQRAEMYCRAIAHNLGVAIHDFLNAASKFITFKSEIRLPKVMVKLSLAQMVDQFLHHTENKSRFGVVRVDLADDSRLRWIINDRTMQNGPVQLRNYLVNEFKQFNVLPQYGELKDRGGTYYYRMINPMNGGDKIDFEVEYPLKLQAQSQPSPDDSDGLDFTKPIR
jgi:hypothetical protein